MKEAELAYAQARRYAPHIRIYDLYLSDAQNKIADRYQPRAIRIGQNAREVPPFLNDPKFAAIEGLEFDRWTRDREESGLLLSGAAPDPNPHLKKIGRAIALNEFLSKPQVHLTWPTVSIDVPPLQNPSHALRIELSVKFDGRELIFSGKHVLPPALHSQKRFDLRELKVDRREAFYLKCFWLDSNGVKIPLR